MLGVSPERYKEIRAMVAERLERRDAAPLRHR
jgi:hypothetical protein